MRRLRVLTHGAGMINQENWDERTALGWHWNSNVDIEEYQVAAQKVRDLQTQHGSNNVTVGHPFNRDFHHPYVDPSFVGIYVKDISKLVMNLQRDMSRWAKLTPEEVDEL